MIFLTAKAHKNSKLRNTLFILFIAVIIIPILTWIIINPSSVKAAWFNDSYAYRKYTSFTHNAALTDRRVSISLDTATLITDGKMQSDCDDTRFTDSAGKVLRYQLTGACNNAATTYDVLIPTVVNGLNAIYIYYGNPLAVTGSTDISSFTSLSPSGGAASLATEEKGSIPVLYWSFNEGNGTTAQDSSQNNNDATLTNSPTWQPEDMCVVDKCLRFDGSDDRAGKTYSSDTELNPGTGSFTISAWIKHASAISGTDTILSRADGLNGVGYKIYMNSSGNLCFGIDASAGSFPSDSACSTTTYNDSQWHFLQAVKSGTSNITLYVDGNQVAQDASITSSSISGTSSPIYAGIDADTSSNPWTGFIDEIKIYNYAKTTAQLQADKSNSGGTDQTSINFGAIDPIKTLSNGLVGYWKMDEASWTNDCSTESVLDSSGNNNNGAACPNTTGPTGGAAGKFNKAGSFDGSNDAVDVDDSNSLDVTATENLTISAWVRRTGDATFDDYQHIVDKQNTQSSTSGYLFMAGSGSGCITGGADYLCFQVHDGTNRYYIRTTSATITTDSIWHHVVAVLDRNSIDNTLIYIDGVAQDVTRSGTLSSVGDLSNSNALCIGKDMSGINCRTDNLYNFNGQLDEVRIYKRAFSKQEVSHLYNFGSAPVGYWKLDEGSGSTALDSGTIGASGTLTSGPSWASGKYGRGVSFDATDDDINLGTNADLDFTTSMTISAWIYPTAYGEGGYGAIFSRATGTTQYEFLVVNDGFSTGRTAGLALYNDISNVSAGVDNIIALNQWQHVAVTVTNSLAYFYVNGKLINSSGTAYTFSPGTNPNFIGSYDGDFDTFGGRIDEIKAYNYALSNKQIINDMNAGHPTVGTPVSSAVGHWSFDEGSSTTANDKSPNANNLTLSTASWTTSGKFATAWNGTGALWLSRADDSDFDFAAAQDFTLSTWVKSDSTSNPAASEYIISKETSSAGYALWFNTGGEIVCGIDDDGTSFPEDSAGDTASNTDFYDNTWHHIVCTRDTTSGRLSLYIDGRLFDSDTSLSATGDLSNSDSLTIGDRNATNDTDDFNGDIDETKIYRAALTSDEVKIEFNQGKAQILGSTSTESDGITATNSTSREYCIPGDTTSCNPPQAEWKLDENTGSSAKDTSGNGNNGTLTSSPTWTRGKIGAGLNLTAASSQYVSAADSSTLDNGGAMTIEVWIKPTATSLDGNYHDILGKGDSGAANIDYALSLLAADKLSFYWGSAASYEDWQITGTSVFTANQWHHVVATRNSALNAVYFYVNGVKYTASNTAIDIAPSNSTHGFSIGRPGEYVGQYFDGVIDNVRLYNYERSDAQILWSYNRGAPIAHYKMDECTGTTLYNSAVNGNNAPLGNNGTFYFGANTYTSAGTCSSGTSSHMWNAGTTGKYSSAGAFDGGVSADGDTHIALPDNAFDSLTTGTVSMWFKPSNTGDDFQYLFFAAEDDDITGSDYFGLFTQNSTQGAGVTIRNNAGDVVVAGLTLPTTYTNWHHLAYKASPSGNVFYIDGKPMPLTYVTGSASNTEFFDDISENTTSYTLGCSNTDGSNANDCTGVTFMYEGLIDDVRIYNYPLTDAQVKTVYNENAAVRFGP
jgi:hypothetical protein